MNQIKTRDLKLLSAISGGKKKKKGIKSKIILKMGGNKIYICSRRKAGSMVSNRKILSFFGEK